MMKRILSAAILTLGLVTGLTALAVGSNGDIYEIRPCYSDGTSRDAYATIADPLGAGETVYFNVRFIQATNNYDNTVWYLDYVGYSSAVDEALYPLQIGIYVSGELRYADLVNTSTANGFTDLIFSYKTVPGDFALPIVLATGTSATDAQPAGDDFSTSAFLLNRTDKWVLRNTVGQTANFWYWENTDWGPVTKPESDSPIQDYSLSKCGFYVQTIDFDDNWEETGTLWRSVHEGSTITVGSTPSLVADSAVENATTLYVWSTDETSVYVSGGTEMTIDSTTGETAHVGTITIAGGATTANFLLYGVESNKTANLVLSSWDHYNYSDYTGDRITDYIEVPVSCIEALPPSVVVTATPTSVEATSDYLTAVSELTVTLSQPYADSDVTVEIRPSFSDGTVTADWTDYIRWSTSANTVAALPTQTDSDYPTVTIAAGETSTSTKIYIYALKGDSYTSGTRSIVFTPYVTDATIEATIDDDAATVAALRITSQTPVITSPTDADTVSGIAGAETEVEIVVEDTYADMSDTTTGYTIYVKYRATDTYTQLDGVYYVGANNTLYLLEVADDGTTTTTSTLPKFIYPASGEHVSTIYIVSPVSGQRSDAVSFNASISAPKTVTLSEANDQTDFSEGDQASFVVTLSDSNETGQPIYAYLLANGAEEGMFQSGKAVIYNTTTANASASGIRIQAYGSESSVNKIKLLDGYSESDGGLTVTFEVVLCSSSTFDPASIIQGYSSNYLNLTIYNVEPTIKRIEMNGIDSSGDGTTYANSVPKGMTRTFKAIVTDPGTYDKTTADDADTTKDERFQCRWTYGKTTGSKTTTITYGDPDEDANALDLTFNTAGTWSIMLQVRDKDMDDWSDTTYTVYVTVLDQPEITLTVPDSAEETDTEQVITLEPSYWDDDYDGTLTVQITVSEYGTTTGRDNPGELKLDSSYLVTGEENVYQVTFTDSSAIDIGIVSMDGTVNSSLYGFTITAEVVNTETLPTSSTPANEYYIASTGRIRVNNVAPVCYVSPLENTSTNTYTVASGVVSSPTIRWQVRSDVDADFAGITGFQGIKVSWSGTANDQEIYVNAAQSGTVPLDFTGMQGDTTVTLTIEDKDGDMQTWTWYFTVTAAKTLQTAATGPGGGISTSTLSTKYANIGTGLGEGHTYVDGGTFSKATSFTLSWNCGSSASVNAYAFGYKVANPTDDGSLNGGLDVAIGTAGSATSGVAVTDPYVYTDTAKDSFFYGWILHSMSTEGTWTHEHQGISPERPNTTSVGIFSLPTEAMESGGYPDTIAEAIFSKEFLAEDNLGDINQDAIPDLFAVKEWGGGNLIELVSGAEDTEDSSAVIDNDTLNLANSNPDEDYLPGVYNANGTSYAAIGPNFTTRMEIRGFHDGLNATDVTTSDASFSDDEQAAYEAYLVEQGLAADADAAAGATPDLTVWSPEPTGSSARMDPTMDDTDGDGFTDGWEYYFWYMAHVWVPAGADRGQPRTGQTYVFERFNFDKLVEGDEITRAEVEERFNPCESNTALIAADADFDGDGLSDLEELVLGTNPCHWDTDGDRLSDAWEVMMSLNPLSSDDKDGNPDGDYMAYAFTTDLAMYESTTTVQDADGNDITTTSYLYIPNLVEGVDYAVDETTGARTMLRTVTADGVTLTPKTVTETAEDGTTTETPYLYGREGDTTDYGWGIQMVTVTEGEVTLEAGATLETGANYILIHDQVRAVFGFDPRTGWYAPADAANYFSTRWSSSTDPAGCAVNTREYFNYDEYLVVKYRRDFGLNNVYADQPTTVATTANVWNYIVQNSTNPSIVVAETTDDDEETTDDEDADATEEDTDASTYEVSQAVADAFDAAGSTKSSVLGHGADTDEDGVPDGWELYVGYNPTVANTSANSDRDGDSLSFVAEYAGTDSCAAYSGCSTIYANHPSQSGSAIANWYNKFLPTDPTDGDTDDDGITDAMEGGSWTGDFYNGGETYSTSFTAIYGTPTDDNTRCIRGGGMNPCTVDTDADGLPDGWEMQHAGVPFDAATLTASDSEVTIATSTLIADGLYTSSTNATTTTTTTTDDEEDTTTSTVYLAGGMDPTWNGDRLGVGTDSLLGTTRDLDFDQDGLQNWQEYVIQSIRHFRWDDVTTPLMGRMLSGADGGYTMAYKGYVPFDSASPDAFMEAVEEAWGGTTDIPTRAEAEGQFQPWTQEGWRDLGYFAPPKNEWDRAYSVFTAPVYMMPIGGWMAWVDAENYDNPVGYISTDPRLADTDGDSLDDYYEMFHGLNPILGTDPSAPEDSVWGSGKSGDIVSLVYRYTNLEGADTLATYNAYYNAWIFPTFNIETALAAGEPTTYTSVTGPACYDPILYPWIMGTPLCDADGDGVRNSEESVKTNLTDPMPTHTDPSPAWFTDHTKASSFTAQYYATQASLSGSGFSWWTDTDELGSMVGSTTDFLYAYEEGEGYDTDNDWVPDNREMTTTTSSATDALDFSDPDRRQALYLDGTDSFAMAADTQIRAIDASDLFKQFTAECWVRPEKSGAAQTIIERCCLVPASSINSDSSAIRANFRIGIASDGRAYGMFDNNDAVESGTGSPTSCQIVYGKTLSLNEWTHVALTFDGSDLTIYINGEKINSASTSLVPANGVFALNQTTAETNKLWSFDYSYLDTSFFIGARPAKKAENALVSLLEEPETPAFTDFQEFFQGYVDEVRLWDGARTADEILSAYATRFSKDDVEELREEVYTAWRPDLSSASADPKGTASATRNGNDGLDDLPAELVCHYNFVTLPGAVNAGDVATEPTGFTSAVLGAAMSDYASNGDITTDGLYVDTNMRLKGGATVGTADGDLTIGWWDTCAMHSTVYSDYHVVPWIENTVAHLPVLDGSCVDTFLYGDHVSSGYIPAEWNGLQSYTFPNTAVPYMYASYGADRYLRLRKLENLYTAIPDASLMDLYARYRFHIRSKFVGTSDLVPMGGAYAKTCDEMWDGAVADAWEYTGTDDDGDGLPDWWEEYARNNYCAGLDPSEALNWDTEVTYKGTTMPAYQAYLIDLALGMQPDGSIDSTYAATADADGTGIPDWWEELFGVDGEDLYADSDNDGLSNYAEYLLSFVFDLGQLFDPTQAYSASDTDIDYFFPIGSLYAGQLFTDADMMEDSWEVSYGTDYVNKYTWDATSDNDEDGWSAFSECRYNAFTSSIIADQISHILGDTEMKDFPIPTLKLTLRYTQSQVLSTATGEGGDDAENQESNALAPIVVKTYTETSTQSDNMVADATYTIQPGETVDRVAYLGLWGERVVRGTLTPGYVSSGSVTLEMASTSQANSYTWVVAGTSLRDGTYSGTYAEYLADYGLYGSEYVTLQTQAFEWQELAGSGTLTIAQDGESSEANICIDGTQYGTLNLQTGAFSFDLEALGSYVPSGTNETASLTEAYYRLCYQSQVPVLQSQKLALYLGTPNTGYVREGTNRIVAFYDLDEDGEYTPGEPLGFNPAVDVSWSQGAADIELTDTTPVITRMKLEMTSGNDDESSSGSAETDRYVLYGSDGGDYYELTSGEFSGGTYQRVRIARTLVNGYSVGELGVPSTVVMDKWFYLDQRPYIFEGDILSETELDLDWSWYQDEVAPAASTYGLDVTSVVYRVILGNGSTDIGDTNNLFSVATTRTFDVTSGRVTPTLVSPGEGGNSIVYGSRPTFKWTMNGYNSYTAFKVQVLNGGSVVWDSGERLAPARDSNGNYVFEPDVYLGDLLEAGVTYTWRCSMYNAKFRSDAWSSNPQDFVMASSQEGYGTINVCAKYFGPALSYGTIRVEAYENPDFSGDPVARAAVTDTSLVGVYGTNHTVNATLCGLAEGEYYVRAYLDDSTYGTSYEKDDWESWGYACPRQKSADMFTPSTISVSTGTAVAQTILVYIEDVDQNGNNTPDAWEMHRYSGSLSDGVTSSSGTTDSGIVVDSRLSDLLDLETGKVTGGLAAQVVTTLSTASVQELILGVEAAEGLTLAETIEEASEVVDGTVSITAVSFDQANGEVTLTVEADVENEYATSSIYTFTASATVTCTVWYTPSLAQDWTEAGSTTVTVGAESATITVDVSEIVDATSASGFYKVTLEEVE